MVGSYRSQLMKSKRNPLLVRSWQVNHGQDPEIPSPISPTLHSAPTLRKATSLQPSSGIPSTWLLSVYFYPEYSPLCTKGFLKHVITFMYKAFCYYRVLKRLHFTSMGPLEACASCSLTCLNICHVTMMILIDWKGTWRTIRSTKPPQSRSNIPDSLYETRVIPTTARQMVIPSIPLELSEHLIHLLPSASL